jgi:hypothetical protein
MYPECTDPSEWVGTPEYEEIHALQQARRQQLLDLIEEQSVYDTLEFPYRYSH